MSDQADKKEKQYVSLVDMSGRWGTVRKGRSVPKSLFGSIGGEKVLGTLVCLESEYEKIVSEAEKKDADAIKKGEDIRSEMIKKRKTKPEPKESK